MPNADLWNPYWLLDSLYSRLTFVAEAKQWVKSARSKPTTFG